MPLDRRHLLRQIGILTKLGVSPMDIERTISWLEAHLPANVSPDTWIPSAADLSDDGVISEAAQVDARQAWYASKSVPRRFRRLLDAGEGA